MLELFIASIGITESTEENVPGGFPGSLLRLVAQHDVHQELKLPIKPQSNEFDWKRRLLKKLWLATKSESPSTILKPNGRVMKWKYTSPPVQPFSRSDIDHLSKLTGFCSLWFSWRLANYQKLWKLLREKSMDSSQKESSLSIISPIIDRSQLARDKLQGFAWQILPHPAYSNLDQSKTPYVERVFPTTPNAMVPLLQHGKFFPKWTKIKNGTGA